MPHTSATPSEFEPPYTLEVGGTVAYKSVPTYARAISLAEAYAKDGVRRKVEVFDRSRARIYVSEGTATPA